MIRRRQILALALSALAMGSEATHAADAELLKRFGAPKTRIQGGTRSAHGLAEAEVLLSEEAARSASPQPDLYWFMSKDFSLRIDLTVIPVGSSRPLVDLVMKRGAKAGIHRLSLAEQGVRLEDGRDYVFAATLVPDPTVRAADISGRGTIRYQPHTPFADALAAAKEGYWIEAFAQADPTTRAALLDDVNLPHAAAWQREATA